MNAKPMFAVVTGEERFKVTDLSNGGVSFFDEILDAYRMAHLIANECQHGYQIEDRKDRWYSLGGPTARMQP